MEQILVILADRMPTGFASEQLIRDEQGFAPLVDARFIDRGLAESDERYRQVIPYVLLHQSGRWFSYARTRQGREPRLHDRRSLGIGGHINPTDLSGPVDALRSTPMEELALAARREIAEEVTGLGLPVLTWLGFICSQVSDVERVHLGVVYVAEVRTSAIDLTIEGKMTDARFVDMDELRRDRGAYEGWSRIVIDYLLGSPDFRRPATV